MEKFKPNVEAPTSLSEIEAIRETRNTMVRKRECLESLVEAPLLEACQKLYDKNIQTLATSANKKDIEAGEIYIAIDFGNLSLENQEIAKQYADVVDWDEFKAVKITISVNEQTSMLEIKQKVEKIANAFKEQPMTWAPKYTLENLKEYYGIASNDSDYDDPKVWEEEGYYYDKKDRVFYISEEHYKKTKKYTGK